MKKNIFMGIIFISLIVSASAFASQISLTGKWNGNDGGVYYITQIRNEILWYGERSPTSPQWSNVAHGTISGNRVSLRWADVPKGNIMQHGQLVLEVSRDRREMTAKSKTGGFGGSSWTRQRQ